MLDRQGITLRFEVSCRASSFLHRCLLGQLGKPLSRVIHTKHFWQDVKSRSGHIIFLLTVRASRHARCRAKQFFSSVPGNVMQRLNLPIFGAVRHYK